jgi:hypothetical protein
MGQRLEHIAVGHCYTLSSMMIWFVMGSPKFANIYRSTSITWTILAGGRSGQVTSIQEEILGCTT